MSNENTVAPGQIIKVLIAVVVFLVVAITLLAKLATGGFNVDAEVMCQRARSYVLGFVPVSSGLESCFRGPSQG